MPRGRPRKHRLTRMDAAIDAMTPYGFSEEVVKRTVEELLSEYGGDDSWPFIEEYGYKELIDAILRDQEGNKGTDQNAFLQHNKTEDHASIDVAGPSVLLADSISSETFSNASENVIQEPSVLEPDPICYANVNDAPKTDNQEHSGCLSLATGGREGWKDIGLDQSSCQTEITNATCGVGGSAAISDVLTNSPRESQPIVAENSQVVSSLSITPKNSQARALPSICPENNQVLNPPSGAPEVSRGLCPAPNTTGNSQVLSPLPAVPEYNSTVSPSVLSRPGIIHDSRSAPLPQPSVLTPVSVNNNQVRARRPCYGWIGSDDEDVDDFIYLRPYSSWHPGKLHNGTNKQTKRKSRWDVRPGDP